MMKNILIYFFVILIVNSGSANRNYDMDEELFGSGKGHESHYVSFKKWKQDRKVFLSTRMRKQFWRMPDNVMAISKNYMGVDDRQ